MIDYEKLKKHFSDTELEWKPQSVGIKNGKPWAMILCYVQARAIQNRLDEVFGPMNWKDEYRFEQNGVICRLSVYCSERKEWIAKENGSPETDIESFKGGISGAFKRVASSGFGIGRYLYELDTTFADCLMTKKKGYKQAKTKDGQYLYWKEPKKFENFSNEVFSDIGNKKFNRKVTESIPPEPIVLDTYSKQLDNAKDLKDLQNIWESFTKEEKEKYVDQKNLIKDTLIRLQDKN